MFSSIDPVYVVLLIIIAAGGGWWYWSNKKKAKDAKPIGISQVTVDDPMIGRREKQELEDNISQDEPEVPVLSKEDMKPAVAAPVKAPEAEKPQQKELELPLPEPELPRDLTEEFHCAGHRFARIDTGIEAVLHFTPTESPAFEPEKLKAAQKAAKALEMPFPLQFSFFSAKTGLWTDDAADAEDCREFYLSTLTANRRKKLDNLEVSRFLGLADRLGIDLAADVEAPDAERVLATADKVSRIVEKYTQYITFKLVGARDIDDSAFNEAALGCGFVYSEGHYEKREQGVSDPLVVLGRMPQLKNELGLALNIPLTNPAAKPLTDLCAIANDLACRLDLEFTDPYGAPVDDKLASQTAWQLNELYREMANVGVAAGSPRARRIFCGS